MTTIQAFDIIEMQRRDFRKLHNKKFTRGNYEYRIRYEGGFAEFFAIQRREIGAHKFKYYGGLGAAFLHDNFAVIDAINNIIDEREGA